MKIGFCVTNFHLEVPVHSRTMIRFQDFDVYIIFYLRHLALTKSFNFELKIQLYVSQYM